RAAVAEVSAGGPWTTTALNMRGPPESMMWELAWLVHREVELARRFHPISFNAATRVLRAATTGGAIAQAAQSLLQLTPQEWVRQAHRARLSGTRLGSSNDNPAIQTIQRHKIITAHTDARGHRW